MVHPAGQHWSPLTQAMMLPAGVQAPPWHAVPKVHALPSSHAVPSATFEAVQDLLASSQAAVTQFVAPGQTLACPLHLALLHVSVTVQNSPSSHALPLKREVGVHLPVTHWLLAQTLAMSQGRPSLMFVAWQPRLGTQAPVVQAVVSMLQSVGAPALHLPAKQVSLEVQGSPSWHGAPSLPAAITHILEASSQLATRHGSIEAGQARGEPVQEPFWHLSFSVQNRPSSQLLPSLAGSACFAHRLLTQMPAPHTSSRLLQSAATLHAMPPLLLEVACEDVLLPLDPLPPPLPPAPPGFTSAGPLMSEHAP